MLLSCFASSALADEFDYNTAWKDIQGSWENISPPDIDDYVPDNILGNPESDLGNLEGVSTFSLYPEEVKTDLVTYKLKYRLSSMIKEYLSTDFTDPLNWTSVSLPATSFNNDDSFFGTEITFTQGSNFDGYLMEQGGTYDVSISGIKYVLRKEVYTSSSDDIPTNYIASLTTGLSHYGQLYIYGIDAAGNEYELETEDVVIKASGLTSTKTCNFTFRVKSVSHNFVSIRVVHNLGSAYEYFSNVGFDDFSDSNGFIFWRIDSGVRSGNFQFTLIDMQQEALDDLTDTTTKIEENTSGILDAIVNLPTMIFDNLIGLFVPDENFYNEWYTNFDNMLADRLGFVYQSFDYIIDFWTTIIDANIVVTQTLTVPEFSYTFIDGTVYTFGGWEVRVVPEGFESLQSISYSITMMIMCLAMMNYGIRIFERFVHS